MSAHDSELTLQQIVEVCDKAVPLRHSTTWEAFCSDWRQQMLAERLVEVMGKAVKRLPDDLRAKHPEQPWHNIVGMRNYLAHGYDSVDHNVVWSVIDIEVDKLKTAVLAILAEEFPNSSSQK